MHKLTNSQLLKFFPYTLLLWHSKTCRIRQCYHTKGKKIMNDPWPFKCAHPTIDQLRDLDLNELKYFV